MWSWATYYVPISAHAIPVEVLLPQEDEASSVIMEPAPPTHKSLVNQTRDSVTTVLIGCSFFQELDSQFGTLCCWSLAGQKFEWHWPNGTSAWGPACVGKH